MALPQQLLPNFVALPTPPASSIRLGPPVPTIPTSACGSRAHLAAGVSAASAVVVISTVLAAKKGKAKKKPAKPRHYGPKKLKSGYWQQDLSIDDDINVFEWFNAEELEDYPPAKVTAFKEVAKLTEHPDGETSTFDAPEYRPPPEKLQLAKGLKEPAELDQCLGRSFAGDMQDQMAEFGTSFSMEDTDIIISFQAICTMLAWIDGTLTEDMRAKGLNTRRGSEPERVDLFRVGRVPDAPNAISIGTVWNWVPENATNGTANFNKRSYDVNFERVVTGQDTVDGPPSIREVDAPTHYRILSYNLGDLKLVVRVPIACTMPTVDDEDMPHPGMAVQCSTANERDAGDIWSPTLGTKYAEMQLGDVGMLVRGIVDRGFLVDLQELTQEDFKLDRPSLEEDAQILMGRLAGLLQRIKEVADCPGCVGRVLYLQYCDAEIRVISPWTDEELKELETFRDVTDKEVEELVFGPEA